MKRILTSSLVSLIFLAIGLCLVINPGSFMDFVCYIAGAVSIVIAAIRFYMAYRKNTIAKEAFFCIMLLALGVVLIVLKDSILGIFPLIIGICFLVYGLLKIIKAFSFKNSNEATFKKLLISALIGIGLSVLILAFSWLATNLIQRFIGVLLIYNCVENIFSAIVAKPESNKKNGKKNDVEAESEDVDDSEATEQSDEDKE